MKAEYMRNASVSVSTGRRIKNEKLELAKKMRREMTYGERCFWNGVRSNHVDAGYDIAKQVAKKKVKIPMMK